MALFGDLLGMFAGKPAPQSYSNQDLFNGTRTQQYLNNAGTPLASIGNNAQDSLLNQQLGAITSQRQPQQIQAAPTAATSLGGGQGGAPGQDLSPYMSQVQGDQNSIANLYSQLYGGIDRQVQDQSGQPTNQYNNQFDTMAKQQADAVGKTNDQYTARNAFGSSYRENAVNDLNTAYQNDVNNATQAEQAGLAGLGKYATTAKSSLDASKPQYDLSQYNDVASLQALHNQLGQHIQGLQSQLAGQGTNQDYLNTLQQIAPSQAATQLSQKLATLASSSAAPDAKNALMQGYLSEAQLNDPSAKSYWTGYFNDLMKKQAPQAPQAATVGQ